MLTVHCETCGCHVSKKKAYDDEADWETVGREFIVELFVCRPVHCETCGCHDSKKKADDDEADWETVGRQFIVELFVCRPVHCETVGREFIVELFVCRPVHRETCGCHVSKKKADDDEADWETAERSKRRCIYVTGQRGLTEYEAAELIIKEAKKLFSEDLLQMGVDWKPADKAGLFTLLEHELFAHL